MFARIIPFGVKGVLWYQGESNGYEFDYLEKYLLFMRCMRDSFENPNMPFYAIELASFGCWDANRPYTKNRYATKDSWAFLREQQQRATEIAPNNYLITSMGLGDFIDIHPIHKKPLAQRMSRKILKYSYNFSHQAYQPIFQSATFENGKAYISLKHADGLYANNLNGLSEVDMYLADESRCLKRAKIEIENNTIILSSDEVKNPYLHDMHSMISMGDVISIMGRDCHWLHSVQMFNRIIKNRLFDKYWGTEIFPVTFYGAS